MALTAERVASDLSRGGQPDAALSLAERILGVMSDLGYIKPTGRTPFDKDKPALSIGDVEEALRPLLAARGILVSPNMTKLEQIGTLWRVDLHFVVTADDVREELLAEWADIGNSPSAAVSFCRKSFYKSLFHIADGGEDDSGQQPARSTRSKPAAATSQAPAAPIQPDLSMLDEHPQLTALATSLPTPWDARYLAQELTRLQPDTVLRRLKLEHARQCRKPDCEHVLSISPLISSNQ